MAPPPPPDKLIAAVLAALLGMVAPATQFVVTVLRPAAPSTASCADVTTATWEGDAQKLADQLSGSGGADAQSLAQQLESVGVTPSAGRSRDLTAPTTSPTTSPDEPSSSNGGSSNWQDLAAKLSDELANSTDPDAQKLAQAIGDTGTPSGGATRSAAPRSAAPSSDSARSPRTTGQAAPAPGSGGASRSADPSASAAASESSRATGSTRPPDPACPPTSGRSSSETTTPSGDPTAGDRPSATGSARPTAGPTASSSADPTVSNRRWEQLAQQLAVALAGSTDPRAAILKDALDQAGFGAAPSLRPSTPMTTRAPAPRTTIPVPDGSGGG